MKDRRPLVVRLCDLIDPLYLRNRNPRGNSERAKKLGYEVHSRRTIGDEKHTLYVLKGAPELEALQEIETYVYEARKAYVESKQNEAS